MENVAQLLISQLVPSNIDEQSSENLFTSKNKPVPPSLITIPNKISLPISNFLTSENSAYNQDKPSQDYFEARKLSHSLENYAAKTIVDITSIGDVHATLESIKNIQIKGKLSRTYFVGLPLAITLHVYDTKKILDVIPVRGVHAIFHALKNNVPVTQQIAMVLVLLMKKNGESVAKSIYHLNYGPLVFLLYIDLFTISIF